MFCIFLMDLHDCLIDFKIILISFVIFYCGLDIYLVIIRKKTGHQMAAKRGLSYPETGFFIFIHVIYTIAA